MNTLIIGSGGREHAFAWKIGQSPLCKQVFIAPGNAGTAQCGTNIPVQANDFEGIKKVCTDYEIDMLIVGPEDPLVNGIYDFLKADEATRHISIIGPCQKGARLEGSKAYAKAFMEKYNIPTAAYKEFSLHNFEEGIAFINQQAPPIVLKADGLAAGKGVIIAETHEEAIANFTEMIKAEKFGKASSKVVIEQFLTGIEMSVFALTDGRDFVLLPEAKDYKRIGVGDTGLNTGGMGAISPVPFYDNPLQQKVLEKIVQPTISGIAKEGFSYCGFVFFGLMICKGEPYVIEYNCRMGDPETEAVLPRIENDLLEVLVAATNGNLKDAHISNAKKTAATIVAVSGGYPGDYEKGRPISGLGQPVESIVFHSGTIQKNEEVLSNGGRVLAVTSFAENISEAVRQSAKTLAGIGFEGMYFRDDIGWEWSGKPIENNE